MKGSTVAWTIVGILIAIGIIIGCVFGGIAIKKKYFDTTTTLDETNYRPKGQKSLHTTNEPLSPTSTTGTYTTIPPYTIQPSITTQTPAQTTTQSPVQAYSIRNSSNTCIDLNSSDTDDYLVLKTFTNSMSQFWVKQTAPNSTAFSFYNLNNPLLYITIDAGAGSITADVNANSSSQLWQTSTFDSTNALQVGNNSYPSQYLVPYDSTYAVPSEPVQLVLSLSDQISSQYSQDQINAVVQGQTTVSADQSALDQASGNAPIVLNGLPLTLIAQNSTAQQTWYIIPQ